MQLLHGCLEQFVGGVQHTELAHLGGTYLQVTGKLRACETLKLLFTREQMVAESPTLRLSASLS